MQTNQGGVGLSGSYAKVNIKPNGGKNQLNCDKNKQPWCDTIASVVFTERAIKTSGRMFVKHKVTQTLHSFLDFAVPDGDYTMDAPKCFNNNNLY